jgi:hypothetical protein
MNAKELIDLFIEVRAAQKRYFKTRSPVDLDYSKGLERQVDRELKSYRDGPSLFGEEDES